jgi:glycosyltransferase involved in cell wall biosynthesis
MILPDHFFPPDIRVENEAKALISAGHEVHLISPNRENGLTEEIIDQVYIHRLPNVPLKYKKHEFLWNIPVPFNPLWIKKIIDIVKKYKIEILHAHDLPLVALCIVLGKVFRIPVVFDMHENWPEGMRLWGYGKLVIPAKILERFSIKYADRIIVVIDEQKERLVDLGVPENKISIIMNTVNLDMFNEKEISQDLFSRILSDYKGKFVISYIGGFSEDRGIDVLIKALPDIIKKIHNAHLLLVGDGKIKNELQQLAQEWKVSENVTFAGWVDQEEVPAYMAISNVCVIPHYANSHINRTIPHKLFQYMAMGKPIVSTDALPLKRIIESNRCGIVVLSGNASAMSEAIIKLCDDELAAEYGKNGKKAALSKYNWDVTSQELCGIYDNLFNLRINTLW